MNTGLPLFYRVKMQRFGVDLRAVQEQHGLEMMLGNAALASIMGPDRDIATPITEEFTVLLCENCADASLEASIPRMIEGEMERIQRKERETVAAEITEAADVE